MRNDLISFVDELTLIHSRLKTAFAPARKSVGLGQSEMMVLNAVVEADRPPTVPQIGRSMGTSRQLIQRSTNILIEAGLIDTLPNPDHKRAALLVATQKGEDLKMQADKTGEEIAVSIAELVNMDEVREVTRVMSTMRKVLEARYRDES